MFQHSMVRTGTKVEITEGLVRAQGSALRHGPVRRRFRNLSRSPARCDSKVVMNHPPALRQRAPRVNLRGDTSAAVNLQNGQQLRARMHRLSITGGLLELDTYLSERIPFGLTVYLNSNTVRGRAETLFPMRSKPGYLQPFRFTDLREEQRTRLETEIGELLRQAVTTTGNTILGVHPPRSFLESL